MNRDDIFRMGRDAGLIQGHMVLSDREVYAFERFAALIAAHEREACAKVCDGMDHNGVMIAADCATAIRARGQA